MNKIHMKSAYNFVEKNNKLFLLILVNAIIEIVLLIFFYPTFEMDDDFAMGLISSGFYGESNKKFLVFSNVVLGFIVKFLTAIANSFAWYINIQYILLFLAVVTVFFVISKFLSFYFTLILNFLFWYINFFNQVRFIQFTRTAAFVTVAGCLMLGYALCRGNTKQKIWGYVLIAFGICIREKCALICLAFFIAMWTVVCLDKRNMFKKYAFNVLIIFGIYALFWVIDYSAYVGKDWKNYTAYNEVRSEILDYGVPSYEQNEVRYKSIGFSPNDVNLLANWMFADESKYSFENLKAIASWREPKQVDGDFIKANITDFLKRNYANRLLYVYLAVFLICVMQKKWCRLYAGVNIFIFMGMEGYLYYSGRVVERVEYAIILSALSSLTFMLLKDLYFKGNLHGILQPSNDKKVNGKKTLATFLFVALSIWNLWFCEYADNPAYSTTTIQLQLLEKLSNNTGKTYMLNTLSFPSGILSFKPYKKAPEWWLQNFGYLGGWSIESPLYKYHIEKLGLKNPMKDMLYKDSVYYVKSSGEDVSMELTYFQENYSVNANAESVEEMDGYTIWKFYVGSTDN